MCPDIDTYKANGWKNIPKALTIFDHLLNFQNFATFESPNDGENVDSGRRRGQSARSSCLDSPLHSLGGPITAQLFRSWIEQH